MNDNKSEKDYFNLLNSGMFWEIYPELTGEWDKDKEEFIKNEQNFRKMNDFKEKFEPLQKIENVKVESNQNHLPTANQLPWPEPSTSKVTPILALYFNIDGLDDIQEAFDFAQKSMEKYAKHGWTYIIIPITDGRDSFIESHSVERLDPIELKQLETKILETIKTGE